MTTEQFQSLFQKAKELMAVTKDANHDWSHIERVLDNIKKIMRMLPEKIRQTIDEKLLILAAVWHDVSYHQFKAGVVHYFLEGQRVGRIAEKYFLAAQLDQEKIGLLVDVVRHHTFSTFGRLNRQRTVYHQILQDADTIDMFNASRLAQTRELARQSWFWRLTIFFEPYTRNWFRRHRDFLFNFPELIKQLERKKEIVFY